MRWRGDILKYLSPMEESVWSATFAAAFVGHIERTYEALRGTPGHKGRGISDLATEFRYGAAELAKAVADEAVLGMREVMGGDLNAHP